MASFSCSHPIDGCCEQVVSKLIRTLRARIKKLYVLITKNTQSLTVLSYYTTVAVVPNVISRRWQ